MNSQRLSYQSTEIVDSLRCIVLSTNPHPGVRLRPTEWMASAQVTMLAFRLSGRGVF